MLQHPIAAGRKHRKMSVLLLGHLVHTFAQSKEHKPVGICRDGIFLQVGVKCLAQSYNCGSIILSVRITPWPFKSQIIAKVSSFTAYVIPQWFRNNKSWFPLRWFLIILSHAQSLIILKETWMPWQRIWNGLHANSTMSANERKRAATHQGKSEML